MNKDLFGNKVVSVIEDMEMPKFGKAYEGGGLVVSFSGGRTSAYMAWRLLQVVPRDKLVFVFANTGKENEETLKFVHECDKRWGLGVVWIEAEVSKEKGVGTSYRVVDFETASRNGKPFWDMFEKYGLPNNMAPHCTRELKQAPIYKFVKDLFKDDPYQMAIGMRYDERKRINQRRANKFNWVYPLTHWWPTAKIQVRDFWRQSEFDLGLEDYQGNCDLCFKKSRKKRLRIMQENPEKIEWWAKMEEACGEYTFDRHGVTIKELSKRLCDGDKSIFDNDKDQHCSCFS